MWHECSYLVLWPVTSCFRVLWFHMVPGCCCKQTAPCRRTGYFPNEKVCGLSTTRNALRNPSPEPPGTPSISKQHWDSTIGFFTKCNGLRSRCLYIQHFRAHNSEIRWLELMQVVSLHSRGSIMTMTLNAATVTTRNHLRMSE